MGKDTFLQLYKVYACPHLEYAVAAWSPWTKADRHCLEKLQRRPIAMVSNWQAGPGLHETRLEEEGMTTLQG